MSTKKVNPKKESPNSIENLKIGDFFCSNEKDGNNYDFYYILDISNEWVYYVGAFDIQKEYIYRMTIGSMIKELSCNYTIVKPVVSMKEAFDPIWEE